MVVHSLNCNINLVGMEEKGGEGNFRESLHWKTNSLDAYYTIMYLAYTSYLILTQRDDSSVVRSMGDIAINMPMSRVEGRTCCHFGEFGLAANADSFRLSALSAVFLSRVLESRKVCC